MIEVSTDESPLRWVARDGDRVMGRAAVLIRPDERCFVRLVDCRPAVYRPLVEAVAGALRRDLHVQVVATDHVELARLRNMGFVVARREIHYHVPTGRTGRTETVVGASRPSGFELISAADADLERLRVLDEVLREDIPGANGWRWSREDFAEETFGEGFDPQTYLVATRTGAGEYAGLVRVWVRRDGPRLGMIGVRRPYRRTRLVVALGAAAFRVLRERGYTWVWADVDPTNRASMLLVRRLGAREVGGTVELVRSGRDNRVP